MTASVNASDVQRNFGAWHDKALQEPVQVTKYGRETVYIVAASTFREMWQSFRLAKSTLDLTDSEMAQILAAKTPAEHDYDYEEDHETAPAPGMRP